METCTLDLHTDYLLSSTGATTATGLSRLLDGELSHDHITRWLSQASWGSAAIWRQAKPLIRQAEAQQKPDDFAVLLVDDSVLEKVHTDANELICCHWDHSQQRHVKGLNFVSLLYQAGELAVPIAVELVRKTVAAWNPKTQQPKYESAFTKNEYVQQLLRAATATCSPGAGSLSLPAGRQLVRLGPEHDPGAGAGPSLYFRLGK